MPKDHSQQTRRTSNLALSFFVFLGSFLGAVLGAIANLDDLEGGIKSLIARAQPGVELNIAGSDSVLGDDIGIAQAWVEAIHQRHGRSWTVPLLGTVTSNPIVDIAAVGSHKGLDLARQGKVHLLVMSDPLDEQGVQSLYESNIDVRCAAVIGYDAIVFVTDLRNPLPGITEAALSEILTGETTDWGELSDRINEPLPIHVLAREGSGTTEWIYRHYGTAKGPRRSLACASNEACLNDSLALSGSLYWASRTWLTLRPERFRHPLRILRATTDVGDDPLATGFNPNNYPSKLLRGLYVYVLAGPSIPAESSDLAQKVLDYVLDVEGQHVLVERRFLTYLDTAKDVKSELPAGFGAADQNGRTQVCR